MLIKGIKEVIEIEWYLFITDYKYLGIMIDNELKIIEHIGIILIKAKRIF